MAAESWSEEDWAEEASASENMELDDTTERKLGFRAWSRCKRALRSTSGDVLLSGGEVRKVDGCGEMRSGLFSELVEASWIGEMRLVGGLSLLTERPK